MSGYYPWLDILLCSFNGITFILLSFLWLREHRKSGSHWGGYLYLYITVACAVPICLPARQLPLVGNALLRATVPGDTLRSPPTLCFPPCCSISSTKREGGTARPLDMAGRSVAVYALGLWFAVLALGALGRPYQDYWSDKPTLLASRALMVAAAAGCGMILWTSRRPDTDRLARNQRRALLLLCGVWACVYLVAPNGGWGSALAQMLPLGFGFVITYYVERPTFFDVLIKKGSVHFLLPAPSGGVFPRDRALPAAVVVGHSDRRAGLGASGLADRACGALGSAQVVGLARPALPRPPLPSGAGQ